jgi:hypothetical protein
MIVSIYVDNLIITGHNISRINTLKQALNKKFDITDLGRVKNLLGIEIRHLQDRLIFLH